MNIYIMSMGQLTKSDYNKSIKAFADILSEQTSFPFSVTRIYINLFLDKYWYKTIDKYKLGLIDFTEFKEKICSQIGIKCDDNRFKYAWNKMCEMDENSISDVISLIKLQNTQNFKLIIPSVTNESQCEYIIKQINDELSENNLVNIYESPDINIVTSFDNKKLSLIELVKLDIEESNLGNHRLVSLNNNIKSLNNNPIEYIKTTNDAESGYLKNIQEDLSHTDRLLLGKFSAEPSIE